MNSSKFVVEIKHFLHYYQEAIRVLLFWFLIYYFACESCIYKFFLLFAIFLHNLCSLFIFNYFELKTDLHNKIYQVIALKE